MPFKLPQPKNRPIARTLLLMLLLAAAAATAWGLVSWKNRFIQEGVDILESIRDKGLDRIWADEPRRAYYLIEDNGHVIGMEIRRRVPTETGFEGHEQHYHFSGDNILTRTDATWMLNNGATTGTYQSHSYKNRVELNQTTVLLTPGELTIQTLASQKAFMAKQAPPANYIPEGLLPQVMTEVVRRKTAARLKITLDNIPPVQGHILYASLFLRYVGPSPDDASLGRLRCTRDCPDPQLSRLVTYYDIDANGHIIRETTDSMVTRRTTPEELIKHFPEASHIINSVSQNGDNK